VGFSQDTDADLLLAAGPVPEEKGLLSDFLKTKSDALSRKFLQRAKLWITGS